MIATTKHTVREHVQAGQDGDQWLHGDDRVEWVRQLHAACKVCTATPSV
jgi:hypothetical protein